MPTNAKLTIKQAKFAAQYVTHGNASCAYRDAYDAQHMSDGAVRVEACRLLQHPNVAQHIDEARKRMATKAEITQQTIIGMLIEDREFAQSLKNASAATAASMGLAKVTGHLAEDRKNTRMPLQDMSTEMLQELERMLVESLARTADADGIIPKSSVTH